MLVCSFYALLNVLTVFGEEVDNYITHFDFEDKEIGTLLEDFPDTDRYRLVDAWNKDGTVKSEPRIVEDPLGEKGKVVFLEDLSDTAVAAIHDIPRQEEPFTVEVDFMAEEFGHATKVLRLLDGSTVASEIELRTINGKDILGYSIPGGHEILVDNFELNKWYNIKLLVNPSTQEATPIIDGVVKPTYKWRYLNATGVTSVLTMTPATSAVSSYFDNLKVYEGIDDSILRPDEPPEKVTDLRISSNDLSISLEWEPANYATSYTVKMATEEDGPFEEVRGAMDIVINYAKVDVYQDGTYYFLVEANNRKGSTSSEVVSITVEEDKDRILAFPSAEGGGKFTTGGRGHDAYVVTTLEDYRPSETPIEGSLRHALSGPNRTIVFAVSGTIFLKDELNVQLKNVTIAGETAPGDGITVANYGLRINGSENVIIRYMRFRPGVKNTHAEPDALEAVDVKDIIIDHVSTSWSTDETLSMYRSENTTVQWSMISESLTMSGHVKGKHGYGAIFGGKNSTYHHNIIAHHTSRNPRMGGSTPGQTNIDFHNNVVYNWSFYSIYGGNHSDVNIINNYMKPGPGTRANKRSVIVEPGVLGSPSSWYVDGNHIDGSPNVTENNHLGIKNIVHDAIILEEPVLFPGSKSMNPQPATEAYHEVIAKAGAILPKRDAVDARIINEIINGKGRFINNEAEVGGYPILKSATAPIDTDQDGIPDVWEKANQLDPQNPEDGKRITESGYSNLELYLHSLTEIDHYVENPTAEIVSPTQNSIHKTGDAISIETNVTSNNNIEKVELYNGAEKIDETTQAPYQFDWSNVSEGTHFVSIKVTDKKGNQTQSTAIPIHVNGPLNSEVWKGVDIGNVAIEGNTSITDDNKMIVKGSGRITGKKDAFHFAYQTVKGDGEFIAKIESITAVDNNAIAGIMIRSNLESDGATAILSTSIIKADRMESETPYSIHLSTRQSNGLDIDTLNDANYPDEHLPSILSTDFPYWLKLVREGNTVTAYASADGSEWVKVGTKEMELEDIVYIGFAIDAAKDSSDIDNYNRAVFSQFETTMQPVANEDITDFGYILNTYIENGEIGHPLAKQLNNTYKQALHHYEKGSLKQANKFLDKFERQLNNKGMQKHITDNAKHGLIQAIAVLRQEWS